MTEQMNVTGDRNGSYTVGSVLTCSAAAYPDPTYSWTDPTDKVIVGPNITLASIGDNLLYICQANNSVGSASRNFYINVQSGGISSISKTHISLTVTCISFMLPWMTFVRLF